MNNIIQDCITKRKIVELFLKYPKREFTVNEMSKLSGISYATTWRFILKLDKAGIILARTIGHSMACRLNEVSPFLKEIKKALEIELSPHRLAVKNFVERVKGIREVKRAILFGSVARKNEKLISDIDLLVITDKKDKEVESRIISISDKILERSKMKIMPLILTEEEAKEDRQFAEELERGEMVYERVKRS